VDTRPAVFFSYVRADDQAEQGRLSGLRQALETELRTITGDEWAVFQDIEDIEIGEQWKKRLEEGLSESTFFMPILTPRYLKSAFCRDELTQFLLREAHLGRGDLVFPLLYLETPALIDSLRHESDALAQTLASRNWDDWRLLRLHSLQSAKVRRRITSLAKAIVAAYTRSGPVDVPSVQPPLPEVNVERNRDIDPRSQPIAATTAVSPPQEQQSRSQYATAQPLSLEPTVSQSVSGDSLWTRFLRYYTRPRMRLGVALGSKYLTVFIPGDGIVLRQPSVVAMRRRDNSIVAVGDDALRSLDSGLDDLLPIYPVTHAGVADEHAAAALLSNCFKKVVRQPDTYLQIIATTASGATNLQNRALRAALKTAGATDIYLLENPLAAAIGEGENVQERYSCAVIYCGATVTDVALIGQSRILFSRSIWLGGDTLDEVITEHFQRNLSVIISKATATRIKEEIGTLTDTKDVHIEVSGHDMVEKMPKVTTISSQQLRQLLLEPVTAIFECIRQLLACCPADMSPALTRRGFLLAGGGALLHGLDSLIAEETHLPVKLAHQPRDVIAIGAGKAFEILQTLKQADQLRR
jgi:rod shape-determining protein MreB and related proteins